MAADQHGNEPIILAGRYRLLHKLGHGGMGVVYLAEQVCSERRVAIKILDTQEQVWSDALERFVREARLATRVHHPNVVEILDFGSTPRGVVYLVMELLEGRDLRKIARGGGLCWSWARYIMRQVCAGVGAIHQAGIIHRDLKASNCFFLDNSAMVKVLDFGIATTEPMRPSQGRGAREIIGTPEYMAPEQIRGEPIDRRADVYAAGVLLCELLCGCPPFVGRTAEEVFEQQLERTPPPIASLAPELVAPPELDELLQRALAKQPSDRFPSMEALAEALDALGESPQRRPRHSSRANESRTGRPGFEDAPTRRHSSDRHARRHEVARTR